MSPSALGNALNLPYTDFDGVQYDKHSVELHYLMACYRRQLIDNQVILELPADFAKLALEYKPTYPRVLYLLSPHSVGQTTDYYLVEYWSYHGEDSFGSVHIYMRILGHLGEHPQRSEDLARQAYEWRRQQGFRGAIRRLMSMIGQLARHRT